MTAHLPKQVRKPEEALERASGSDMAPILYAGGMLALGVALLAAKPRIGNVPEPMLRGEESSNSRLRRVAIGGRDGFRAFAPSNVTDSIGRSLIVGGAALFLTRLFDEIGSKRV